MDVLVARIDPQGKTPLDARRLEIYANDLTKNAYDALKNRAWEFYPSRLVRDFYIEGLKACRDVAPESVHRFGTEMATRLTTQSLPEQAAPFALKALRRFYYEDQPLDEGFFGPKIVRTAVQFAAARDMARFCSTFLNTEHFKNHADKRDIGAALKSSLEMHGLTQAHKNADIILLPAGIGQPAQCEIWILTPEQRAQLDYEKADFNFPPRPKPGVTTKPSL